MGRVRGWENWLKEYCSLVEKTICGEESLSSQDSNHLNYLRNILEAGLGTKTTLSEDNQRTDLRIPLETPVILKTEEKEWRGLTVNISIWGMFVSLPDPPPIGVKGQVLLDANGRSACVNCEVKWATGKPLGALPPGAGLRFFSLDPAQHKVYREFCNQKLEDAILHKIS